MYMRPSVRVCNVYVVYRYVVGTFFLSTALVVRILPVISTVCTQF